MQRLVAISLTTTGRNGFKIKSHVLSLTVNMNSIVQRTNLMVPLPAALAAVSSHFDAGEISEFDVLRTGYQDLNVMITTPRGKFVAKFFSKIRSLARVKDVIKTMVVLNNAGLPVPRVLQAADGPVYTMYEDSGPTYISVFEYFEGNDFSSAEPTSDDLKYLSELISSIHSTDLLIDRYYDDWGAANILPEYSKAASFLSSDALLLVEKTTDDVRTLDAAQFQQCAIHGDVYRSHVLRSRDGRYCLIDFGCVDFNWAILDLAIFLAWFCFDGLSSLERMQEIYILVLSEYMRSKSLTSGELAAIPILIRATYAAYQIATSRLMAQGDNSVQTKTWNEKSLAGLSNSHLISRLTC